MTIVEYFKEKGQEVQEMSASQTVKQLKTAGVVFTSTESGWRAELNSKTLIVLSKEPLVETTKLVAQDTYSKKLGGFFACLKVVV